MGASFMNTGEYLFYGQEIWASNCGFKLALESNGNLVIRDRNGVAAWAANTGGSTPKYAKFQTDGNFIVSSFDGSQVFWKTNTANKSATSLKIQSDANLVMTNASGGLVWNLGVVKPKSGVCSASSPKVSVDTSVLGNTDFLGADIGSLFSYDIGTCGSACAANASCRAWTWVPASITGGDPTCFLKGSVPSPVNHPGMVSGRKNQICNGCVTP
jgi:hypothetical protein